jgi:glutathione synthase/RimK-type ligase-like ATP-grasp enzyme
MTNLVVVSDPTDWPLDLPGAQVISADGYLTDPASSAIEEARVFNLCRSYRYQRNGYYVSLLAAARGHRPIPSVTTIQGMKSATVIRSATDDLDQLIQRSLAPLQSEEFLLSIYFGRNMARRYDGLARELFNLFPAPLLRARFVRDDGEWRLGGVRLLGLSDIPASHNEFLLEVAADHFRGKRPRVSRPRARRYDLAILVDPEAESPPSDETALRRFVQAAERIGFATTRIGKQDYGELAEFDALFIRDTTYVNHYTYRFSAKAAAEGLVVIDDPESIVRCTNKVYIAEVLERHKVPAPATLVVHRGNVNRIPEELGLPCVLKQPDSAFSLGVVKVDTMEELVRETRRLLEDSDLIVAQSFMPTEFDWRIGILDDRPLYACRYHMARDHWQIVHNEAGRGRRWGRVETIPVEQAPRTVVRAAARAAHLIGDGLYGVDVKQHQNRVAVIEVNDNPSIESGFEDRILGHALYDEIARTFLRRVEERGFVRSRGRG